MKDLTNHDELAKQIPKSAREFRFGNMILKITKSKQGTYGFIIKNAENPKFHHTLVAKDNNVSFHHTKETDGIIPNQHQNINYVNLQNVLAKSIQDVFSNAQRITLGDSGFIGKNTLVFVSQKMIIIEKTSKKVVFDQEIEYEESLFEDIDVNQNRIGFIFDENDNELCMIIINNGVIYKIDLEQFDIKNSEIEKVYSSQFDS